MTRWSYSHTARITVAQPTPRSTATRATSVASSPTRRADSARALSVSTARGRIAGARSDQVRRPHLPLGAPPNSLEPHQRHRPAAGGQIPHPTRLSVVQGRHHATGRALSLIHISEPTRLGMISY